MGVDTICFQPAHWSLLSSTLYSPVPPRHHRVPSATRPSLTVFDALMTSYARHHASVNLPSGSQQHPHYTEGQQHSHSLSSHAQRRQKFVAELSQCLFDYVIQLLPTVEELTVKEDVRKLLERLIRTIEPQSHLLSFGSTANGFSLRNSDMDLVCLIDSEEKLPASDLVTMVGDLLERETKFHVKPLPHARIPIVKLSLDPSPGLPRGIACDIGFENRLALENTRLLLCYSMVDPARVRTLVLFLKVWSKRRKINSPYEGTLSSYGYVLLVIYFLVHVKNPPVLPNLQQIPPLHPIPPEEHHMGDRNIWFFDDIELLRQRWKSQNTESVGELLIDFFRYYAKDFTYNTGVASIRAGLLKKETRGWQSDNDPRFRGGERNRLCIEDPFETDYNVARCVTRDGLYIIRGEFMRASRILQLKQERGYNVLAHLCEERDDSLSKPSGPYNTTFVPPRLSFPPQTPYSVGSNPFRPNGTSTLDRLSPPRKGFEQAPPPTIPPFVSAEEPPEHMAPKRSKFTSPPPPEAPDQDVASFESRLCQGLSLATAPTDAREQENAYMSSSSNSEVLSDDARSDIAQEDDARSVQSFAGEPSSSRSRPEERPPFSPSSVPHRLSAEQLAMLCQQANFRTQEDITPTPITQGQYARGRRPVRALHELGQGLPPVSYRMQADDFRRFTFPGKSEGLRRSNSGPARAHHSPRMNLVSASVTQQMPFNVPLPPSPVHVSLSSSPTIYYETSAQAAGGSIYSPAPTIVPINPLQLYQQQYYLAHAHAHAQAAAQVLAQSRQMSEAESLRDESETRQLTTRPIHSHTHSASTIVGPPTPAASSFTLSQLRSSSNNSSQQSSPSHSPGPTHTAFGRLPPIQTSHAFSNLPSPSPTSPFGLSSRSSAPPQSQSHFTSPQLSSQLPHFTRRPQQMPAQLQAFMHAHMNLQATRVGIPSFGNAPAPSSLDLASPTDSPMSSGSSQGGSGSGSAGSPGSLSPVSSASPRTTDINSPCAPSPDHQIQKPEKDQQQPKSNSHNHSQHAHERKAQPFSLKTSQNRHRQQPFSRTRTHRVTVPIRGEEQNEGAHEEGTGAVDKSLPPQSPQAQSPQVQNTSSPERARNELSTSSMHAPIASSGSFSRLPPILEAGASVEMSHRTEVSRDRASNVLGGGESGQDWERVSIGVSQLQL